MSKISEFIKLVPDGIKNIDSVLKAVANDKFFNNLSKDKQDEIVRRRLICKSCPFMSKNVDNDEFRALNNGKDYVTSRSDEHCTFCGCPISTRTAALDKNCGIEKYNENHNPLPLKWEKYEG